MSMLSTLPARRGNALPGYKIAKISSFASNLPHLALWLLFLWLICLGQHECTQVEKYYSVMRHASSSRSRLRFILCIYINRYVYLCIYSVAVKFPPCSPAIKKSILHASLQSSHHLTNSKTIHLKDAQYKSNSLPSNHWNHWFIPTPLAAWGNRHIPASSVLGPPDVQRPCVQPKLLT